MSSPTLRFSAFVAVFCAVLVGTLILPKVLLVTGHEGDLLHLLDTVFRLAEGDRPHLDFMTPLGVLAFWPIQAFLDLGFGPGRAFLLGQAAVTLAATPLIWWVAASRLEGVVRIGFAAFLLITVSAMVFGGPEPAVSVSMHYNRWGWVLTLIICALVMLPPRPGWSSPGVDGVIIGLSLAVLAFLKMTFVVALLPFLVVALLHDRAWSAAIAALFAGVSVMAGLVIGYGGFAVITAYVSDLLIVSGSSVRPQPGLGLSDMVAKPAGLPATAILVASIVLWRRAGLGRAGMLLLLLAPGWLYITYQNWGNDPKYLVLLAVFLLSLPLPKPDARILGFAAPAATRYLALAALVIAAPSAINTAYSSLRHMALIPASFAAIFPEPDRQDIAVRMDRNYQGQALVKLPAVDGPLQWEPPSGQDTVLNGEVLPACKMSTGFVGWTQHVVRDLATVPDTEGKVLVVADVYDHMWLFGPYPRLTKGAVWYYGGAKGVVGAELVLVPLCPLSRLARKAKLAALAEEGLRLREIHRTEHYILTVAEPGA